VTPELGHLALILALLISITQGVLPLIGAHKGHAGWIALARPAAQTQFVLVAFAFILINLSVDLVYALLDPRLRKARA
jgi:cytochrome c-type biogenesis protein CcmF